MGADGTKIQVIDPTVNYKAMIPTTGFPLSDATVNGSDLKYCGNPALNAVGDLCYISTGRPVAIKSVTTASSSSTITGATTDEYDGTALEKRRQKNIRPKKAVSVSGGGGLKRRRYAKPWSA